MLRAVVVFAKSAIADARCSKKFYWNLRRISSRLDRADGFRSVGFFNRISDLNNILSKNIYIKYVPDFIVKSKTM